MLICGYDGGRPDMSAGLAGPGGEGLPPSCLGHLSSKVRRSDGAEVYLYDL